MAIFGGDINDRVNNIVLAIFTVEELEDRVFQPQNFTIILNNIRRIVNNPRDDLPEPDGLLNMLANDHVRRWRRAVGLGGVNYYYDPGAGG